MPAPGTIAAKIDLSARLRVFDVDGSLAGAGRDAWKVIEPEVRSISEAYWQQWLRCFPDDRTWASHETERMIDVGCVFLKNRFLDTSGRAWIESIERSVSRSRICCAVLARPALMSLMRLNNDIRSLQRAGGGPSDAQRRPPAASARQARRPSSR